MFCNSPPAIFSGGRDIELHTSAQDEQSRSLEVSVSPGVSSGDSSGHRCGQSSGQPFDSSSARCAGRQHSTRTPTVQSNGAPTSDHVATRTVTIRMQVVYITTPGRSKYSVTFRDSLSHRPIMGAVQAVIQGDVRQRRCGSCRVSALKSRSGGVLLRPVLPWARLNRGGHEGKSVVTPRVHEPKRTVRRKQRFGF